MAHKGGFVEVTIKAGTTIAETGEYYAVNTTVTRTDNEAHAMEDNGYLIPKQTEPSSDEVLTKEDFFEDWTPA